LLEFSSDGGAECAGFSAARAKFFDDSPSRAGRAAGFRLSRRAKIVARPSLLKSRAPPSPF
jgi:hypothetical protein